MLNKADMALRRLANAACWTTQAPGRRNSATQAHTDVLCWRARTFPSQKSSQAPLTSSLKGRLSSMSARPASTQLCLPQLWDAKT